MTTLDDIAARGNRGGHFAGQWVDNNHIRCADGFELSVIAGGGTYCLPRPAFCAHSYAPDLPAIPFRDEVACDYPGPYTHVEVRGDGPPGWSEYGDPGEEAATIRKICDPVTDLATDRPYRPLFWMRKNRYENRLPEVWAIAVELMVAGTGRDPLVPAGPPSSGQGGLPPVSLTGPVAPAAAS
jgi:hypothetical protein